MASDKKRVERALRIILCVSNKAKLPKDAYDRLTIGYLHADSAEFSMQDILDGKANYSVGKYLCYSYWDTAGLYEFMADKEKVEEVLGDASYNQENDCDPYDVIVYDLDKANYEEPLEVEKKVSISLV